MRLALVDDDGREVKPGRPVKRRRQFSAVELAARERLRDRVHNVTPPTLVASLTPLDRVERMAIHKQVTGSFGPDLARRPGT